jgi:hypothetical protein
MWAARISIIPHRQQFVKRKVAQIFVPRNSRFCATLPIDFWGGLWYTNDVKGRGVNQSPREPLGLLTTSGLGLTESTVRVARLSRFQNKK